MMDFFGIGMQFRPVNRGALAGVLLVLSTLACSSGQPQTRPDDIPTGGPRPGYRPGQLAIGDDEGSANDGMKIESEHGTLDQQEIDAVMDRHVRQLVACYERAGDARRYAAGDVVLRFLIAPTGAVNDVLVIENSLGNYPVERCLVVEGRKIPFPRPGGSKDADFEYALKFRSTGEVAVVDWDADALNKDVAAQMASLSSCGALGGVEVRAVAYIEPTGAVASVGLLSQDRLDVMAAMCVVEQIRKWRLPGDAGHMVRTSFAVSGRGAAAHTEPTRTAPRIGQVSKAARLQRAAARRRR